VTSPRKRPAADSASRHSSGVAGAAFEPVLERTDADAKFYQVRVRLALVKLGALRASVAQYVRQVSWAVSI